MSSPILYYIPPSPPCRAVLLLAQIIGLAFDLKLTNIMEGEQLKPEYLKMNPQHTVPTLNDNGLILWESRCIMTYLTEAYAKNDSLYPKDIRMRAVVDQRLQFDLGTLYSRMGDYYFPTMLRAEPMDETRKPKLLEALGFFNDMLIDRMWVATDQFSVADLSLTVTVSQIEGFGLDLSPYERIVAWLNRCKELLGPYGYKVRLANPRLKHFYDNYLYWVEQDINQSGVDMLAGLYKSHLKP